MGTSKFILDKLSIKDMNFSKVNDSFICFIDNINDVKYLKNISSDLKEKDFIVNLVEIDGLSPIHQADFKFNIFNRNYFDFFDVSKKKAIYFEILTDMFLSNFYDDENEYYLKYDYKDIQSAVNNLFLIYDIILTQMNGCSPSVYDLFSFMEENLDFSKFLTLIKKYKPEKKDSASKINAVITTCKKLMISEMGYSAKIKLGLDVIKTIISDNEQFIFQNNKNNFSFDILNDGKKHAIFFCVNVSDTNGDYFANKMYETAHFTVLRYLEKKKKENYKIDVFVQALNTFSDQEKELLSLMKDLRKTNVSLTMIESAMMFLEDDMFKVINNCDEISVSAKLLEQNHYNQKVMERIFPDIDFSKREGYISFKK